MGIMQLTRQAGKALDDGALYLGELVTRIPREQPRHEKMKQKGCLHLESNLIEGHLMWMDQFVFMSHLVLNLNMKQL